MLKEESIDAIKRFHKQREDRLRQQLDGAEDLMVKYQILKAIYRNRKFERNFWQKYLDIGGKSSTIKLPITEADGGPGSGNHGHQGVPGQVGGSAPKPSARGKNPECTGFADVKLLKRHVSRHIKEYPGLTEDGYVEHAKKFLAQECSDTVDGYITDSGEVVRFDRTTGEYAKGIPGGRIVTCYIAKHDKKTGKANLALANKYFNLKKASEGVKEDGENRSEETS